MSDESQQMARQKVNKSARSSVIDLTAPIIPGQSAGGIVLNSNIWDLVVHVSPKSTTQRSSLVLHDFGPVRVWSSDNIINQIGVSNGYRGTLSHGPIRIGSTISDVEKWFGREVEENEEDSLVVPGSAGWSFETEQWSGYPSVKENRGAHITQIFVFLAEYDTTKSR